MKKTEKIILIPNSEKNIDKKIIDTLVGRLTDKGCTVAVFDDAQLCDSRVRTVSCAEEVQGYDAALVLGGDGSIIEASHRLMGLDIAVMGINFGHVGFLTELEEEELPLVDKLIEGEYSTENRMMLDATVTDVAGHVKAEYTVLNDTVITNGPVARMITFDVYCGGEMLETVRADGVIAATPTGSTAYSLSAGGPVLDPTLEGIALTPICPHTLSSRPIIFNGNAEVKIKIKSTNSSSVYINADGREEYKLSENDTVRIKRSEIVTRLIHVKNTGFVKTLRHKLSEK